MAEQRPLYLMCIHCSPATNHDSINDLNVHLRRRHNHQESYTCGKCRNIFIHKTSFVRHLHQHLRENFLNSDEDNHDQGEGDQDTGHLEAACSSTSSSIQEPSGIPTMEQCTENQCAEDQMEAEAAKFLLNLRASGNITNASVFLISNYVASLVDSIFSNLASKTSKFLIQNGIQENDIHQFMAETFNSKNPFRNLGSTDAQLDYFSQRHGLAIPDEKYLGSHIENRLDRELRMILPAQVPNLFYTVSLLDTLKAVVKNSYLRKLILEEEESQDHIRRSYKDGSDFKENRFLQKYPHAIRILLYYDDLEMASALGSKDVVHKLGSFYVTIQNFPPEEHALLSSFFLLALAYAEDLKMPGAFNKVLTPFSEDLKLLTTDAGVEVDLPEGGSFTLRACLVGVAADTLAAHAVLGFMSPSAQLFCRRCLATLKDLARDSCFLGVLRDHRSHERHISQVERNPALSKNFGVKERSILSNHMRVPEDSCFDIFHDMVGIIQMDIKLALYEFICVRKLFSVDDFNNALNMFVYGFPDAKNKPSPNLLRSRLLSSGHTLKQNGAQTFCLLRVFPFVIKGVNENDKFMELIFTLQDILKIVFAYEVRDCDINRLEVLLWKHNNLFHQIFIDDAQRQDQEDQVESDVSDEPGESDGVDSDNEAPEGDEAETHRRRQKRHRTKRLKKGINKMHHALHFPDEYRRKGPIIRLWTSRFEGRLRIMRKHSAVQSNFRNVPRTMSRMIQLSTFGSILSRSLSRKDELTITGEEPCLVKNCFYQESLLAEGLQDDDEVHTVTSAELCGYEYCAGLFVPLKSSGVHPEFVLISDVLVDSSHRVYLGVKKCINHGLSSKFNSYRVTNNFHAAPELINVKSLVNGKPIAPWTSVYENDLVNIYIHPRTVYV